MHPLTPYPIDWLTDDRFQNLLATLSDSASLLLQSGLLPRVVGYWIRTQIAEEIEVSTAMDSKEYNEEIDILQESWLSKNSLESYGLTILQLRKKLGVSIACQRWARVNWGHLLETWYLEKKGDLDRVSCYLLRTSTVNMAMELYHILRANEASFEELSWKYGEGRERLQGGLLPLQPMARLPFGLAPYLCRLKPGQLLSPQPLGAKFAIVQLKTYEPASFTSDIQTAILDQQLNAWISEVANIVLSRLN